MWGRLWPLFFVWGLCHFWCRIFLRSQFVASLTCQWMNERIATNVSLFCNAACFEPWTKTLPVIYLLRIHGRFLESFFFNHLVDLLGVVTAFDLGCCCFISFLLPPFLFVWCLAGVPDEELFDVAFSCLASSKQNFSFFSWFFYTYLRFCKQPYDLVLVSVQLQFLKFFFLITVFFLIGVTIFIVWG